MAIDEQKLRLLLKDCANGFYQQMYFLGKDVIHPGGNQLQHYGFKKSPSRGLKGTSCYTCKFNEGVIELYGSCAGFYSSTSKAVFLRKRCRFYHWRPNHRLVAGDWSQDDLQIQSPEVMLALITPFLQWWIAYEKWIESRWGRLYREQCFTEWSKIKGKTTWLSASLAGQWVQQLIELKDTHVRPKHFE